VAAVIEFQHVTKIYKRMFSEEKLAALSDLSFRDGARPGVRFSGSQRRRQDYLHQHADGFFLPTSGEIRVFGQPPGDLRAKEQIGFLPENFAFHKFLTAPKLLRFHLQLAGRNPVAVREPDPDLLA
jgi:ABC-2 type transport system ATP-binding protein